MRSEDKDSFLNVLIIIGLIFNIMFISLLVRYGSFLFPDDAFLPPFPWDTIFFGTPYSPQYADPQYMQDTGSFNYAYQVWEGLYAYDLSNPETPLIPCLATDFGSWAGANFTVHLRQNVYFHSGTKFNATAIKFTFDRLLYLTNLTGRQPTTGVGSTIYGESPVKILYMWPNGTAILNRVEIIDEYTVKFVLYYPYGAWLSLLTYTASMILDPEVTPAYDYICKGMTKATSESISGTGPFEFGYCISGIETRFFQNLGYWGKKAAIYEIVFVVITDSDSRNTALLTRDINIIVDPHPSYFNIMRADPDITLFEGYPSTVTQYLGFNNKAINKTWRSAMSFAIDYDYMINKLLNDEVIRLKSPIPLGIQFANWSFDIPILNLTRAREYMVGMGFGSMSWTDTQWVSQTNTMPFALFNYTYNLGNEFREDMFLLLQNNFSKIGIKVINNGVEGDIYLDLINNINGGWDKLQIWFIERIPDYNDPITYINSLMSNVSSSNSAQINDEKLETYILDGLEEIDQVKRRQIYWDLQKYVVEDLRPWAFSYVARNYDAYYNLITGFPSNGMELAYFYPCYVK